MTLICEGANSSASDRDNPRIACFEAHYVRSTPQQSDPRSTVVNERLNVRILKYTRYPSNSHYFRYFCTPENFHQQSSPAQLRVKLRRTRLNTLLLVDQLHRSPNLSLRQFQNVYRMPKSPSNLYPSSYQSILDLLKSSLEVVD